MESCQVTIGNNKIEFQGVKSTYPVGELVGCYFTLPVSCRPESGDWVGIFPVGWSSLSQCLCKKMVKSENVWGTPSGQYGKVEFDCESVVPKCTEQYYQFVYVKNGEYIRGASTPFVFTQSFGGMINGEEQVYSSIFGGRQQQMPVECGIERVPSGEWYQQQTPKTLEQFVMREMQGLQQGIAGLEQCLCGQYKSIYPCDETTYTTGTTSTTTTPSGVWQLPEYFTCVSGNTGKPCEWKWTVECQEPQQIKKFWQSRIGEVSQMLSEQIKIEQAQRKLEQMNMIAHLKQFERHIMNVQKREQEIKSYFQSKMQKQIGEFEQKVYNIMKLSETPCTTVQQPEHYVRKYEQLLKEKIELEQQRRSTILHKLRQTIKECERKLREVQTGEQQHYSRFNQILKNKISQFETRYVQPVIYSGVYSEQVQQELREQLRQHISTLINEQRREQYNFVKAQKQLVCLIQEIFGKLQQLECDAYVQLNIPRIQSIQYPFGGQYYSFGGRQQYEQTYTQVQQLEQQLNELRNSLRVRMLTTPKTVEQLQSGEWIKPIAQKLRELQWNLRQIHTAINCELVEMPVKSGQWYERRIQNLTQHMKFFERQMECKQFEENRLREVLSQLRDLECELCELPQFYEQYKPQYQSQTRIQEKQQIRQIVELCQYLQTIVREKISQLTSIYEQSPIECYIQTGNHQSWKHLMQYERKLVQLKSLLVQRQHYHHLQQRLGELEQFVRECGCNGKQQERCIEQIKCVKQMLEQQQQQLHHQYRQQYEQQYTVFNFPEQFVQHQQRYERLCQLVQDLECQVIEQCNTTGSQQQVTPVCLSFPSSTSTVFAPSQLQQQVTLGQIQQRFERLVQEFQSQMPESTYSPRTEQICQFLRQCVVSENLRNKPYFGQQLREKICEFENILNGEYEQYQCQPSWTSQPQHQVLRSIVRQCRDLKCQIQSILDDWVVVSSGCESEDFNNNNQMSSFSLYEPVDVLAEVTLADLLSRQYRESRESRECREQREFAEEFIPRLFRQHLREQREQCENNTSYTQAERKFEQFERQMENIESLVQSELYVPTMRQQCQPSTFSVEGLINDLESELVKLRLQKEFPSTTTTTTRVVLTPESVCDEINKIVGQNLLTTVLPTTTVVPEIRSTIVKVCQDKQGQVQCQQQQQTTQSTMFVEPTPFGTQCVKVQQRETTQQQQF